jgi:Uma2 family endonuclease
LRRWNKTGASFATRLAAQYVSPMTALPKNKMTADEFLAWAAAREEGRHELIDGEIVTTPPERVRHLEAKASAFVALAAALRRAGVSCHAQPGGARVRVDEWTVFKPDVLVYCGEKLGSDEAVASNSVVIVEILSPSTAYNDLGRKLAAYFSLHSLQHYLVVDPELRIIIHHARGQEDTIVTRIIADGTVKLDPPGVTAKAADFLPPTT